MALITQINEVKQVLPRLVSNLADGALLPNFDRAEEKYLVPVIGRSYYNDLKGKYGTNTLSDDEKVILKHVQLVIGAYAFLDEMAFSHTKITDGGVRTLTTGTMPKAVGWEYKELKATLQATASDGVEVLLAALVAQDSATWTGSEEYRAFNALLIKTGTEFSQFIPLAKPLQTYWIIRTVVNDVQDNYLRTAIGPDLLDYLKTETLGTEESYILKLLKKSLANLTIRHACEKYTAQYGPTGFTIVSYLGDVDSIDNAGRTTAKDLLNITMQAHERDGLSYLKKAMEELYKWNADEDAGADFKTAYEAGPMAGYKLASERDRGNGCHRKIFRL